MNWSNSLKFECKITNWSIIEILIELIGIKMLKFEWKMSNGSKCCKLSEKSWNQSKCWNWAQNAQSIKMLQFEWNSWNWSNSWNLSAIFVKLIKMLQFEFKSRDQSKKLHFNLNSRNQSKFQNSSAKCQINQNIEI